MMVQDRFLYDPVAHRYTVDRYVDDTVKRYGGIDAVLVDLSQHGHRQSQPARHGSLYAGRRRRSPADDRRLP